MTTAWNTIMKEQPRQGCLKTLRLLVVAVGAVLPLFHGVLPAAEQDEARVTVWDGPGATSLPPPTTR